MGYIKELYNTKKRNYRKLNRNLHRDLGNIFFALIIIYSVSGLAINHMNDWNPDFVVEKEEVKFNLPTNKSLINDELIFSKLEEIGEKKNFMLYDFPSESKLKIYLKRGSILYNLDENKGEFEKISRRFVLYHINMMHRNPNIFWTIIADVFAICLILISISGIFMMKGKKGIKGRGKWLISFGFTLPIILLIIL